MRPARDTFLHFLSDNGFTVHNIRKDTNFPDSVHLKMNAVNVQFLTDTPRVGISDLMATVEVVADNELDGVDTATKLYLLLSQSGTTPILDYSNQSNPPAPLGSNLFWDVDSVKFIPVYGDTYYRRSSMLTLSYHLYQAYTTP